MKTDLEQNPDPVPDATSGVPVRVALVYVAAGVAWIALSDALLLRLFPQHFGIGQAAKGLVFVGLSGLLIYGLIRREMQNRKRMEEERERLQLQLAGAQRLEAIGRLTGGIAHDFNNLLTAITGNIESYLAHAERGPADSIHELDEALTAADRAAALTGQLLAVGRKQRLRPRTLDFNAVIRDISGLLQRLIGDRIEVRTRLHSELWLVEGDPGPLEQVIMNLAINARDAMPDGGRLTLRTRNVTISSDDAAGFAFPVTPGEYVRLQVLDTGTGMDVETQRHIYEPFFSTKPQGVGTGLGLATVFGVVKQSAGYIDVHSTAGKGTCFDVYLPRAEDGVPGPLAGGSDPEREVEESPATPGGGETVLVVEDDRAVRSLIIRALRRSGFRVIEAGNGAEALDIIGRPGPLDLVVTDAMMPDLRGTELILRLKERRPELRALLISGYPSEALPLNGSAFLGKPFTPAELVRKVRDTLDADLDRE